MELHYLTQSVNLFLRQPLGTAQISNPGPAAITALSIKVMFEDRAGGTAANPIKTDMFYGYSDIQPGTTRTIDLSGTVITNRTSPIVRTRAAISFVELSDGRRLGPDAVSAGAGLDAQRTRQKSVYGKILTRFEAASGSDETKRLERALSRVEADAPSSVTDIRLILANRGIAAALDEVRSPRSFDRMAPR